MTEFESPCYHKLIEIVLLYLQVSCELRCEVHGIDHHTLYLRALVSACIFSTPTSIAESKREIQISIAVSAMDMMVSGGMNECEYFRATPYCLLSIRFTCVRGHSETYSYTICSSFQLSP